MKVLSLFDGISCGMVALEKAGIPVERYVAYEIDEDPVKISSYNYPLIEHKGDVFYAEYQEGEFDLLIGGSPCTFWSGARLNTGKNGTPERETKPEGLGYELFMQYVRALREAKPKYFLYENNFSISKDIKDEITKELGVEPIMINSGLVSAQNRKRMYWTNIPDVELPEDRNILLSDVIEFSNHKFREVGKWVFEIWGGKNKIDGLKTINSDKSHTLTTSKTHPMNYYLNADRTKYCNLSIHDWEKLQTLPEGYVDSVDIKQGAKYKAIGNGWTVDVIAHIFKGIKKEEREEKQMEMKVSEYQLPEKILFNYEELKTELTAKVSMYETLVYTEENIKDAKADRANLNKLKKALNDERIRREKEYMVPFNDFKTKINEIISIIDKPVAVIDKQVKEYEEKQKQDKLDAITEFFNGTEHPEWLHIAQIMDGKWLNASVSMKSVQDEILAKLEQISTDITTLSNLPEFGFEASEVYKSSLDINKAISEAQRMSQIAKAKAEREAEQARLKAEAEAQKAAEQVAPTEPQQEEVIIPITAELVEEKPRQWVAFQAYMTVEQAKALGQYMKANGIQYKAV